MLIPESHCHKGSMCEIFDLDLEGACTFSGRRDRVSVHDGGVSCEGHRVKELEVAGNW